MSLIIGHPYTSDPHTDNPDEALGCEHARARREQNNRDCGLLRLPSELRVEIYRMAFASPWDPREHHKALLTDEWNFKYAFLSSRGLIQSCRDIRAEAEAEFWSLQSIELSDFSTIGMRQHSLLISALSNEAVASLRRIYFILCGGSGYRCCLLGCESCFFLAIDRKAERIFVEITGPDACRAGGGSCCRCATRFEELVKSCVEEIKLAGIARKDRVLLKEDLERVLRMFAPKKEEVPKADSGWGLWLFLGLLALPNVNALWTDWSCAKRGYWSWNNCAYADFQQVWRGSIQNTTK